MIKHHLRIAGIALLLVLPAPLLAQGVIDDASPQALPPRPMPVQVRMDVRANLGVRREALKASTTTRIQERMQARMASSTERRQENLARQASNTATRIEMQKGLAKRKAEFTSRVLTATAERLDGIIARLESRIAKIKAGGADTSIAEAFVAEAKTYLSQARADIALFATLEFSSDKAQENFAKARVLAKQIKDSLKDVHESLKDAVSSLKEGRSEWNVNATSTASSTPQ